MLKDEYLTINKEFEYNKSNIMPVFFFDSQRKLLLFLYILICCFYIDLVAIVAQGFLY